MERRTALLIALIHINTLNFCEKDLDYFVLVIHGGDMERGITFVRSNIGIGSVSKQKLD
jgi:hypothetical protein